MGAGGGRSMGLSEIIKSGAHRNAAGEVINDKRSLSNYDSFRDMIDGGGAGRSGDTFQGGGVASMLANAFGVAPSGAQRERDLELATNAFAGVSLDPKVATPVVEAEKGLLGKGQSPMEMFGGQQPPAYQPVSYDPRGPMYGDQNAVTDQELMTFAQSMHPDNRYFFLNSDRNTQVQSYLRAMGY